MCIRTGVGFGVTGRAVGQVSREDLSSLHPKAEGRGPGGQERGKSLQLHWQLELGAGPVWRVPSAKGSERPCKAGEEERRGVGVCSGSPHFPSSSHPTLQNSIKKFERELMLERHMTLIKEKQVIVKRQQEEVSRLMKTQVGDLHGPVGSTCMDSLGRSNGQKNESGRWPQASAALGEAGNNSCISQDQALFPVHLYFSGPVNAECCGYSSISLLPGSAVLLLPRPHLAPGRHGLRPLRG